MPLYRRLPKRGFNALKKNKIAKINLEKIQNLIKLNRLNKDNEINIDILKKTKIISKSYSKIKVLGSGDLNEKINLNVDYASKSAIKKLEKTGSIVKLKKKD